MQGMTQTTLATILDTWYDAEYDIKIEVDGVTLYSSADVYAELYRYASFTYIDYEGTANTFRSRWLSWLTQQGHDLKCAYDALHQQYDPLANYDMKETSAEGVARDKDTDTTTPTGTTTMTTGTSRWGYDSDSGVPTDQTESTQSYTDYSVATDREHENTLGAGDLSGTYNEAREHELSRSGNVGVTTSQQMLQAEIDLRQQDLLARFCERFIEKWCVLI